MFENILNKLLDTSLRNNLVKIKPEKYLTIEAIEETAEGPFLLTNNAKSATAKQSIMLVNIANAELSKMADKFIKFNRLSIEETGINILNLTLGILKWQDRDDNLLNSPLFCISAELNSEKDDYFIEASYANIEPNYTLAFKFKTEYNFDLLKVLEQYLETKSTFNEVLDNLTELENQLLSQINFGQKQLKVQKLAYFGIFTYSKISIYNDLIQNKSRLDASPFYQQLNGQMQNFNFELISDKDIDEKIDYLNYYHCLESDGSQEKAIQAAIQGHSFVLQGPPGTGKSQTISNIITELMSRGKRVLFVAEKTAAVDVVYNTLADKGFEKFILRLHSDDNNKEFAKKLLADYEETKSYPKLNNSFRDEMNRNISQYVRLINDYENILVDSDKNSVPLFTLFNNYLEIKDYLPISESFSFMRSYSEEELRDIYDLLKNYQGMLNSFNKINYSKWFSIIHTSEVDFNKIINCLNNLKNNLTQLNYLLGNSDYIFIKNNELFSEIEKVKNITFILTKTTWNKKNNFTFNSELRTLKEISKLYKQITRLLSFDQVTLKMNQENISYLEKWLKENKNGFFRAFSKQYKANKEALSLQDFGLGIHLNSYRKAKKLYKASLKAQKIFDKIQTILPSLTFQFNIQDIVLVDILIKNFETLANSFTDSEFSFAVNYTKEVAPVARFSFAQLQEMISEINSNYTELFKNFLVELDAENYYAIMNFIDTLLMEQNNGYVIVSKNNLEIKLVEFGLENYLSFLHSGHYNSLFVNTFKWSYANWNIKNILVRNNLASDFVKLKDLHERYQNDIAILNKNAYANALEACSKQVPNFLGTERSYLILKAEASKSRKLKSVKNVMSEASDAILQMKRCLMMSPLSVSTYLKDSSATFDVLIIDEASQIKTENALSSIFRANQYIICGDVEQLPPTSFFEEKSDLDEVDDENIYDLDAYESILSAGASFLKSIALRWHYRSKYESLIYSSNTNVYDNTLVSFPSVSNGDRFTGLNFIYTNGIYEDRENAQDADATIKKLTQIIDKFGDKKTIGVITLNITMANYLDKHLNRFLNSNEKYKPFLNPKSKTKFFIKNIENVQGDERDIILLVIGFGPNSEGKISHNFGAINQDAGYKRLNVAASRAKEAMFIVSSLKYSDIDTNKSPARGVAFLKDILKNAEVGVQSVASNSAITQAFKAQLAQELTNLGYIVHTNVGASDFKIDLAIYSKEKNKYVLGLECDGTTFASSRVAKDRDYLRSNVLQSRGWIIYRMWSTDWFKNKDLEMEQLTNFIQKHLSSLEQVKPRLNEVLKSENIIEQVAKVDFRSCFEPLISLKEVRRNTLIRDKAIYLQEHINVISLKELKVLIQKIYTNPKNINLVLDNYRFKIVQGFAYNTGLNNQEIKFKTAYDDDKREIGFLHPKEWEHFLAKAKEFNNEVNYDELAKIALELLGYKRQSAVTLQQVIDILKNTNEKGGK
ncbi:AAA domain-containing protein [Mycoplasma sp. VS410B]|uniref:AAA domain-containing protein n=1 Tax=Mycoplasma sp. VS410B TaxID=3401688 RepID=UPI003AAD766B